MSISIDLNGSGSGINAYTSYAEQGPAKALFGSATITSPGTGRTVHSIELKIASVDASEKLSLSIIPPGLAYMWDQVTGTLTISSTGADPTDDLWRAALRNVVYVSTSDAPAATRSITVTARDDQGTAGTATDTLTITPVNDAPVVDLNGPSTGASASISYTENAAVLEIASSAVVTDVDSADFNGGSLRVSFTQNGTSTDQLSIVTDGVVSLSGSTVSVSGTVVGTVSGGRNGTDLVVRLNGGATAASASILLNHIGYSNRADNPSTLTRTVTFSLNDGDGTARGGNNLGSATATIAVLAVNDAPIAVNVTAKGNEDDSAIQVKLQAGDVDGSIASFRMSSLPTTVQGKLYANAAMTQLVDTATSYAASGNALILYFKPAANFNGSAGFTYTAIDNLGLADPTPASAIINVASVDDPVLARSDTDRATTGSITTGNVVTGVDPDAPGAKLSLKVDSAADGPAFIRSLTHDGITYTLNAAKTAVTVSGTPTPPSGSWSYSDSTGYLTITTELGGSLKINLDGAHPGDYTYKAPASVRWGSPSSDSSMGYGDGVSTWLSRFGSGISLNAFDVNGAAASFGAKNLSFSVGTSAYKYGGIGVSASGGRDTETDFVSSTKAERIVATFDMPLAKATIGVGALQGGAGSPYDRPYTEQLLWTAYNASGAQIGQGTVLGTPSGLVDFSIEIPGQAIKKIVLAPGEDSPGVGAGSDESDFLLRYIDGGGSDVAKELFRYKLQDRNGDQSSANLEITVNDHVTITNQLPTGSVSIAGTAVENQVLSASNTLADADGLGPVSYQWQRNGSNIVGATGSTYTLGDADVGASVRVVASYTDGHGAAESVASVATATVVNVNDAPTGSVSIAGTAVENQVLSASNTLADADGLGTISYQWQRNGSNIVGATGSTYTLGDADVGASVRVVASYTDGHGTAESVASAATATVVNVNDAPTGSVSIAGTAVKNQVLSASNTLADADGLGPVSYQWQRNGSNIGGATGSTYTLGDADVGASIRVVASYTDGHGTAESVTSAATATVVNVNDAPTGSVSIAGTATEDQVLSASNTLADADGLGTISYQWQRNGSNIVGATGSSYTLGDADVGASIRVVASYTDGHGTAESVTSAATATVANVNDAPTGSVSIAGTAVKDQVLSASNTLADADGLGPVSYQWQRNGSNIVGATGSTYTLGDADVGASVRVVASYTDGHGAAESVASVATATVVNVNDAPTGSVSIAGTAVENQVLSASNTLADADGLGTISYQWQRNGSNIVGAMGSTYTLGDADVGASVRVVASYTDGHGTAESVASAATATVVNVNDAPTGSVSIAGTATEDQVLTASNTLADADGLGPVSYQWQRNGSNIVGATGSTYTLGDADVGASIRVVAGYTDGHGTAESVTSAATATVVNVNDAPTGSVSIAGTATEDQVLSASNTLADADGLGTISYQWQRNGSDIVGATGSSYTLGDADVGTSIRVVASYTDGHGTAESVTSAATATVVNVNDAPTGTVSIAGTAVENQVLSASNTLADADGLGTISYQWQRNGSNIVGATGSSYTLGDADVGASIRVVASYTDGHGTAESVTSAATATVVNVNDAPTGSVSIAGTAVENQVLSASNTLADADGLGTISYQWQRNGSNIGGATGSSYTLGDADVGTSIRVVASYTDGHGTAESVTSAATATVVNVNDAPTGTVSIAGTAVKNQVLTASNTLADADGLGPVGYQWQRNGSNIAGATGSSYALGDADVGASIRVVASYTDGHGTAESVASAATATVANVNDAPTGSVSIAGTAVENQVLTASNTLADADGLGTISYQWQRNGSNIAGATGSSYALGDADVGASIRVVASYTDGHGTAESVASAATATVANVNDAPTGTVSIAGSAVENQVLTASNTLADADGLGLVTYQWQRNGSDTGVTGSSYTLGDADVGSSIRVVASYTDGHGTAESVTSAATATVANVNDAPTGAVSIAGTAVENQVLTASNTLADADGLGPVSYQWQRNGSNIVGATGSTYTLGDADVGASIRVVASYTDGRGTAESVASAAMATVVNVNDAPTGTVSIAGTAVENQVLTASNTLADADGLGPISYQWQRNGSNIVGATGSTYTLGDADVGTGIRVVASYTDGRGTAESVASAATATVANVNDAPVVSGAVTGSATEDGAVSTLDALANASDADFGTTLSVVNVPASLPAGVSYNAATHSFTLDPSHAAYQSLAQGQSTQVTVNYGVSDGIATTAASVSWTVSGANDQPFSIEWINPAGGAWETAANWSTGQLPGPLDDVLVPLPLAATITLSDSNTSIARLIQTGGGTLSLDNGSLSITNDTIMEGTFVLAGGTFAPTGTSSISHLTQSGGLLTSSSVLSISGSSVFSGGTQSGSGTTVAQGGAVLSAYFGLDGGRALQLGGTSTANGDYTQIDLNSSNETGSGSLTIAAGATFDDQTAFNGLYIFASDYGGSDTGADAVVSNQGTFIKSGTAGTSTIYTLFDNSGTVDVQSGTLYLAGGGTDVGASYTGAGTIEFGGGTRTLDGASSVTAANATFSGGTTTVGGSYAVSGTTAVSGGTASLTGVVTNLGNALSVSAGSLSIGSAAATVGTITQSGGLLTGGGTLTATGSSAFSGGTQSGSGTTVAQGGAALSAYFGLDGGRALQLGSTSTANGSYTQIDLNGVNPQTGARETGSGSLTIAAGATFDDQTAFNGLYIFASDYGGSDTGADAVVSNQGTFIKSGAAGTSTINTLFNNSGTVDVQSGTLYLAGGGTDVGASYTGAGTIEFGGGTRTLDGASSVTAANATFSGGTTTVGGSYAVSGTTAVSGGTASLTGVVTNLGNALSVSAGSLSIGSAAATVGTITQSGGLLTGGGTLTATGSSAFSGGTQSGSGMTVAQGGAALSAYFGLDGGRALQLGSTSTANGSYTQIDLNGVNPQTGARETGSGSLTIAAGATFDDQTAFNGLYIFASDYGGSDTGADAVVSNQGTFIKSGAAGTSTINTLFNNSGTVDVQSGTLYLAGGGTDVGASYTGAGTIEFGGGTRTLDATSSITGNVTFSGGTTTVNGTSGSGTMTVIGGTAAFAGAATTGSLIQSGGLLTGSGTLTATGVSAFSGGTQGGSGTTIAQGGAEFSSSAFALDGGRALQLGGTSTANGSYTQIDLNGADPQTGARETGSGSLTIAAGATFDDQTAFSGLYIDASNYGGSDTGADAVVSNQGTFIKSGTAGTSTINTLFNNSGTVDVQSGTLSLAGGGTDVGASYTGAGTIEFGGGTRTLDATSSITGNVTFSGGTTTVNGTSGSGTMTMIGGTAAFAGAATTGSLIQSSGLLTGSGTLTATGASAFSGGTQGGSGTTIAQGGAVFSSSSFALDGGRALQLGGTSTANGSYTYIDLNGADPQTGARETGSGSLTIAAGATFDDQTAFSGLYIDASNYGGSDTGADAVVSNQGTFIKSGTAGTSTINTLFNNSGTVDVQSGTLSLAGGGTDVGASYTGAGTIEFGGGTRTLDATSSITGNVTFSGGTTTVNGTSGSGTMTVIGGTAAFAGAATTGSLIQSSGLLTGSGTLTATGASAFSGGTQGGSGTTIAQGGAVFSSSSFALDGGRALQLGGTSTANGSYTYIDLNGADPQTGARETGSGSLTIAAGATFDDQTAFSGLYIDASNYGGSDTGADAVVSNQGTFVKSGAAGTSTINTLFNNIGTVDVQSGTLYLAGGINNVGGTVQADGGDLVISGSVAGTALIAGSSVLEFGGSSSADVTFAGAGVLKLDDSVHYEGEISGFGNQDTLDLGDVAFSAELTLGYAVNSDNSGGTLTVNDGTHVAGLALLGSYLASSFVASSDGHGGTFINISETSSDALSPLTLPHA